MNLGSFSVSLSVKNISQSRYFYEKMGFNVVGGNQHENWLIMKNSEHVIGLFQSMFDRNILTFNPGWDQHGNELGAFTDIREIQNELENQGITATVRIEENSTGPASLYIEDPDGNPILIDQHR